MAVPKPRISPYVFALAITLITAFAIVLGRSYAEKGRWIDTILGGLYWCTLMAYIGFCWRESLRMRASMREHDKEHRASMIRLEREAAAFFKRQCGEGEEWKQ